MKRNRSTRGFTVVEVLIAIAMTAVGFAAVFSLQIGSMQAHMAARDMSAAINLAERYVEMLRRDSYAWYGNDRPQPRLDKTLRRWHTLTPHPVDQNGRVSVDHDEEFGSVLSRQRFCVHYWMSQQAGSYQGLMTLRVRVVWPLSPLNTDGLAEVCTDAGANAFRADNVAQWFSLMLPAIVRSSDAS